MVLVYPWRHWPATQTTVGEDWAAKIKRLRKLQQHPNYRKAYLQLHCKWKGELKNLKACRSQREIQRKVKGGTKANIRNLPCWNGLLYNWHSLIVLLNARACAGSLSALTLCSSRLLLFHLGYAAAYTAYNRAQSPASIFCVDNKVNTDDSHF